MIFETIFEAPQTLHFFCMERLSTPTQGGTVCLFYVHESMTFFKFYGRFMDVFRAMDRVSYVHEFATFDPTKRVEFHDNLGIC